MFRVFNQTKGRVQIRERGRSTGPGGNEIVSVIDTRMVRLREAGLVTWEPLAEDFRARPADAPEPPKAEAPAAAEPVPEPQEAEAPAAAEPVPEPQEAEAPAAAELPEPEQAEALAVDEEPPADQDTDADVASPAGDDDDDDDEEDPRIAEERARLAAADWSDVKIWARDLGLKGRTRGGLEGGLLKHFIENLG